MWPAPTIGATDERRLRRQLAGMRSKLRRYPRRHRCEVRAQHTGDWAELVQKDRREASRARLETVAKLRNEFGERLVILPWWRDFFDALDGDVYHELLLSVVRQTGKSQLAAAAAMTELFVPGSFTLLVAASRAQQEAIFHRKDPPAASTCAQAPSAQAIRRAGSRATASSWSAMARSSKWSPPMRPPVPAARPRCW